MITIRNASEDDAFAIQSVFYKTWLETYPNKEVGITKEDIEENFKDDFTDQKINEFKERLKNIPANSILLVAEDNTVNQIIAVCRIFVREQYNQLQAIYVLPEYQGRGVGMALWSETQKHFNQKMDTIVQVATYNEKAISFYNSLGFVDTGKRFSEERHRMPVTKTLIPEMEMVKKHAE
jgi:ribosomal protein S18 acetylase RimI-like enzyme